MLFVLLYFALYVLNVDQKHLNKSLLTVQKNKKLNSPCTGILSIESLHLRFLSSTEVVKEDILETEGAIGRNAVGFCGISSVIFKLLKKEREGKKLKEKKKKKTLNNRYQFFFCFCFLSN